MAHRTLQSGGISHGAWAELSLVTGAGGAAAFDALPLPRAKRPQLRLCVGNQVNSPEHTDCVLVVHPDHGVRHSLSMVLERLGYDVIAVSTSLRAVWALEHEPERIRAAMVSDRLLRTDGSELLCFIARRYPGVKRVLLPTESSTFPANDVHPEIDRVAYDIKHGVRQLLADLFHEDF